MVKILIIGGGIAGLSMARLLQDNYEVHLVEKQNEWQISGTGLYTPSNGVVALEKMGLGDISKEKGYRIDTRHFLDSSGKTILKINLEKIWGREKPCLGIGRKTLHDILLNDFGNVAISMGVTVEKIGSNNNKTKVEFSNGNIKEYDLVIGADGLYSQTRKLLFGDVPLRTVYQMGCRFIAKRPKNISDWTIMMDSVGQFLIIPISQDEVYCYVNNKKAKQVNKEDYLKPFFEFNSPVPEILAQMDSNYAHWDVVYELEPIDSYGMGQVVLIGDAAHGMPPFMAQGGSLALEDALVLAKLLADSHDLTKIVKHFTNCRKDRILWTKKRNDRRERLGKLPFWLTKRGLKLVGEKTWIEDYRLLAKTPEW